MFFQSRLTVGGYLFFSDALGVEGVYRETVLGGNSLELGQNLVIFDTGVSSKQGHLILNTPMQAGVPEDIDEVDCLVVAAHPSETGFLLRDAEDWAGIDAQIELFTKANVWDTFASTGRLHAGIVSSVASLPDESIEIGVLAKYRTLNQIDPIIWSDTDHRQRHPNDTFFEHLAELERRGREIEF